LSHSAKSFLQHELHQGGAVVKSGKQVFGAMELPKLATFQNELVLNGILWLAQHSAAQRSTDLADLAQLD
jgi:hypothetical protein